MYLYETHVHSLNGSLCGKCTPQELVKAYKQAGYAGLILTDHFIKGNTSVPRDLDFLLAHPELNTAGIEEYADLVHEYGAILVHAHPHRIRDYIDPNYAPRYDVCDGIEVYNASDTDEVNELAVQDAIRLNKLMTSGGDVHKVQDEPKLGLAGVGFERRLSDIKDFVNALKNGEGQIMFHGEMRKIQ